MCDYCSIGSEYLTYSIKTKKSFGIYSCKQHINNAIVDINNNYGYDLIITEPIV